MQTVWSMQVQCRLMLCWDGEELDYVRTVHQTVSVSSADLVLRKDAVAPVRPHSKEADLVKRASEGNEEWAGTTWPQGVTEPWNDVQNPFRITNIIRAPYALRAQAGRDFIHESTHLRPMV